MRDVDIYQHQSFGNRMGFGQRVGLVIVDFTVGFNDPNWFGGGNIDAAIKRTVGLLAFARKSAMPIAHTKVIYAKDGSDAGVFTLKAPRLKLLTSDNPISEIVPELSPDNGELVISKTQASAFFHTGLSAWLAFRRVDTIIVAGCTTSGCIRATVVDAVSHNIRPIVARDCVGDRAIGPHEANLFDMQQKYADVMERDEIVGALSAIP
ncbi:MAG: isochorismatase family protein [Burkholderiales bacterium]